MPIVNLAIVPELMEGERTPQYRAIADGITEVIARSTGAPAESVHVLISEVSDERYAVGGALLSDTMRQPPQVP